MSRMERRRGNTPDQSPNRTQYAELIQGLIVVKHDFSPIPLACDVTDPTEIQEAAIRDTYHWLTSTVGQIISEQDTPGFTDYAKSVQKGIERTMRPKEAGGKTTKKIARMEQRAFMARERYDRKAARMRPREILETKADLLGAEIAINLAKQTLARLGSQSNGSN
jgi:hypothetical protein